jgi:trehalose 6-phosphate synthase/phosphatase
MKRIINAANRLPVTIGRKITASSGGLVSAMAGLEGTFETLWIGWPGPACSSGRRAQKIKDILSKDYNSVPVFLTHKEAQGYYQGLSNSSLWPMLHYMTNYFEYEKHWLEDYENVNNKFADEICSVIKPGDMVWVHDYHLMLLPAILRKRKPRLKIGFFLHTPFPSYEIFRAHPARQSLIQGVLGADLIGFHTFGYMRHFRSTVMRLLGLECSMNTIEVNKRMVTLGVFPIGANAKAFEKELKTERYRHRLEHFKKVYSSRKIVLGVERLDYTKGVPQRLRAIDKFLENYKDKGKVCFIFIAVPTRDKVRQYKDLKQEVQSLVGHINGKHATIDNTPINYIYQSVCFTDLCALYSLADVCLVTPYADGMNLVAKEYVVCKQGKGGTLVLSEFTGASNELFKSLKINPYDIEQISATLEQALEMPPKEQLKRMDGMYERVIEYDAVYWANSFLNELEAVTKFRSGGYKKTQRPKLAQKLKETFRPGSKIALFLDYDGTLRKFHDNPDGAVPTKSIKQLFRILSKYQNIDTHVISGRKGSTLEEWLGGYPVTLIGEHGFSCRPRGEDEWVSLCEASDFTWKQRIREMLEYFVGIVPGSFIEEKISAMVWHYRRTDPEFGEWRAKQLVINLSEMLSNLPIEVHHGKKIVEISSMQVNKGRALQNMVAGKNYDYVVCMGDDYTDESMFRLSMSNMISIKVGKGDTSAMYRVSSPAVLLTTLKKALK